MKSSKDTKDPPSRTKREKGGAPRPGAEAQSDSAILYAALKAPLFHGGAGCGTTEVVPSRFAQQSEVKIKGKSCGQSLP
jgi:hypothetical protein